MYICIIIWKAAQSRYLASTDCVTRWLKKHFQREYLGKKSFEINTQICAVLIPAFYYLESINSSVFFYYILATVLEHNTNYLLGMIQKQIHGLLWPLWALAEMQWEYVSLVTSCMLLEDMMVKHTLIQWSLTIPRQMNGHRYSFWSDCTVLFILLFQVCLFLQGEFKHS